MAEQGTGAGRLCAPFRNYRKVIGTIETVDSEHMIPKTIHFIWVGPKKPTTLAQRCIESWKRYLPEYEIKYWSEENVPMHHPYVAEMYRQKKWAFVSDYIRFWVLSQEGGIYLDADMEVLKSLNPFLSHEVFLGKTKDGSTACGIIGAVSGNLFIRKVLEFYDTDTEYSTFNTSPRVVMRTLKEGSFPGVQIYEPYVFYPCDDGEYCSSDALKDAYATHHWAESWVAFAGLRKLLRRLGIMPLLKRIAGKTP